MPSRRGTSGIERELGVVGHVHHVREAKADDLEVGVPAAQFRGQLLLAVLDE
jgi:hypothetical protein